ncbi:hypothetical protein L0222_31840 [bacterium]|nr:hypothetical protein [bacterium]
MKKQSVFVLFGLLSIAVILGCSQSGENTFENPVAGISGNVNSLAELGAS